MDSQIKYEDTALVKMLQHADSKGFAYLYKNYSKALFAEIKSIVADNDIAEDVLQEVFINIYRKISSFDLDRGRLYTWMATIARNLAIDTVLSKSYRNRQQNKELSSAINNPSPSTTTNIDNIGLRNYLKRLKPIYSEILYLNYFQGYTQDEIATTLKIPLGTVKTRIKAGLLQLKKMMNENENKN